MISEDPKPLPGKNTDPNRVEPLKVALDRRADETPDKLAFVYLGDPKGPITCTYGELRQRARAIAALMLQNGKPGDRVLLLYPPGMDFMYGFLGCALMGAVAVPAPPLNTLKPARSLARLRTIVESSRPRFVLTTADVLAAIRPAVAQDEAFSQMICIGTDDVPPVGDDVVLPPPPTLDDICLIQYTSGSTADPKGASLTHRNVVHNVAYLDEDWQHDEHSVSLNWLPAFHDLGLLYGILAPVIGGFLSVQMSPIQVIQRPQTWLQAMSDYKATHSGGPNFIYELAARKITDAEVARLDLSHWRMGLTAAEPVRAETMKRFTERFSPAGFRASTFSPGYGLSECTCKVAAVHWSRDARLLSVDEAKLEQHEVHVVPEGSGRATVGCGIPGFGMNVVIVDPETRIPCHSAGVGEIWVSGPSVAVSYYGNDSATADRLQATLAALPPGSSIAGSGGTTLQTPHLRTGDLGFLHEGEVFVTGRLKDMIIIRGANYYPQDLEYSAQDACPQIRPGCVAAFAYEEGGEERVGLIAEVPAHSDDIIATIRNAISEIHGLRVHRVELVRQGTIPKTTSGKIQRQASKNGMLTGTLELVT